MCALQSVFGLEEREPDEETRNDVERDLGEEIGRVAPVGLAVALEELSDLVRPVRGEFVLVRRLHGRLTSALGVDALELLLEVGGLFAGLPLFVPVELARGRCTSADDGQDVLGAAVISVKGIMQ